MSERDELLKRAEKVDGMGLLAREIAIARTHPAPWLSRIKIRLDGTLPTADEPEDINGPCRSTNLQYFVSYIPNYRKSYGKWHAAKRKFLIWCDLIPPKGRCRVGGYEDMLSMKKPEAIHWLVEWCDISEDTFRIAAYNPNMKIPFTLNIKKYMDAHEIPVLCEYSIRRYEESKAAAGKAAAKEAGK